MSGWFLGRLPGAGLPTIGSKWNLIAGKAGEQFAPCVGTRCSGAQRQIGPGDNRINTAFKAETFYRDVVGDGRFKEECADKIISERARP